MTVIQNNIWPKNIKSLSKQELQKDLITLGYPSYCANQIFNWIYKKCIDDFDKMTNLSLEVRSLFKEKFYLSNIDLLKKEESIDGTIKYLFKLEDKNTIESALIPTVDRITVCLSTQVGCGYKCLFCLSGKNGFKRNLTNAEIIDQLLCIKKDFKDANITHIVMMGVGEPLDNYNNTLKTIRIFNDKDAFAIGIRRITISTCGLVPQIERLAKEGLQVELSVSLHASNNKTRDRLMPINKKFPLEILIKTCRNYAEDTNRKLTFEYILIDEVNNSIKDAYNLVKLLKGLNCKINLIALNKTDLAGFNAPAKHKILTFKKILEDNHINVTIRRARGQDIHAACGQLKAYGGLS